jgi:hypothetical protein
MFRADDFSRAWVLHWVEHLVQHPVDQRAASGRALSCQGSGRFPDHPRELLPSLQRVLAFVDMKIEAQSFENRIVGYGASIGQTLAVQRVNPAVVEDSGNS